MSMCCDSTVQACLALQGPPADTHTHTHVRTLPLSQKGEANECVDEGGTTHVGVSAALR